MKMIDISKLKLLIVEDQFSHFEVIQNICKEIGFEKIFYAENGIEAITLITEAHSNKEKFDFIIADINMPQMNGIELLKKIRTSLNENISRTPYMIISVLNDHKNVIEAVSYGASDYILKPLDKQLMLQKISTLLILQTDKKSA